MRLKMGRSLENCMWKLYRKCRVTVQYLSKPSIVHTIRVFGNNGKSPYCRPLNVDCFRGNFCGNTCVRGLASEPSAWKIASLVPEKRKQISVSEFYDQFRPGMRKLRCACLPVFSHELLAGSLLSKGKRNRWKSSTARLIRLYEIIFLHVCG